MPNFRPITLNEKEKIEYYLDINKYPNSEYSFGSIFAWQKAYDIHYDIIENCLCMVYTSKGKTYSYFPLGKAADFPRAHNRLIDYFDSIGTDFAFSSLSEPMIKTLTENGFGDLYETEGKRDFFDYVYQREKLVTLSGKKLNGKRNHYNFFVNNYEFEMREIDESNEALCEAKFKEYILGRSLDPVNELDATIKMLKYRDHLGITGKTLYANGDLVGIILGGKHHKDGLLHIAKADVDYRGASVALFKHYLEDNLTDCHYVNLMEDMGIEGLRKSKMAYRPEYFVEKYKYQFEHACVCTAMCRK